MKGSFLIKLIAAAAAAAASSVLDNNQRESSDDPLCGKIKSFFVEIQSTTDLNSRQPDWNNFCKSFDVVLVNNLWNVLFYVSTRKV